jgi:hypothetical protein
MRKVSFKLTGLILLHGWQQNLSQAGVAAPRTEHVYRMTMQLEIITRKYTI